MAGPESNQRKKPDSSRPRQDPSSDAARRFRGGGPRALAATVAKIAGPMLRSRGFAEARVITDWPDIVGAELAVQCCPVKLAFRRGRVGAGVLHVRVDSGWAVQLQHLEPLVVERINGHFGYRAVERLHMVQGPLPLRGPARPSGAAATSAPASPHAEATLVEQADGLEDGPLRDALTDLARAIARRSKAG